MEDSGPVENKKLLVCLTFTAAIGGFLFGYDTGIIGGANLYIYSDLGHDSSVVEGAVTSLAVAGAVVGSVIGGPLSDSKGRKTCIIISDVLTVIGALLMGIAPSVWVLMVGRLVVGVGIGLAAMVVPVYLAETAPPKRRGAIVSTNVLMITGGQLISYLVCLALGENWRVMLGLGGVPALLQLLGMLFLPESPRYLFMTGRNPEALEALLYLRFVAESRYEHFAIEEVEEIKYSVEESGTYPYKKQFKILWSEHRNALKVGVCLQVFQQFVGINTAMYYGPEIMQAIGFDNNGRSAIVASLPVAFANMIGSVICIFASDSLGRRSVLLRSIPAMVFNLLALSVCFYFLVFNDNYPFVRYLAIVAVMLYILCYSVGLGSCPWIVNSEIFPLYLRSCATSVTTTSNWVANFAVSMSFAPVLSFDLGKVVVWGFFALVGVISWIFIFTLLPETKGKTLEEILLLFRKKKASEKSFLIT